jgi:biotin carboxylase
VSVLILNRGPLTLRPYHDWLADHRGDLVLLTSAEELQRHGERLADVAHHYAHAEAIREWDTAGHVEARALELARIHRFTHVVACQELDLQRAAAMRELLDLPGQRSDSADSYRDKLLMKQHARAAGLAVAPHAVIETVADVLAFVRVHGFPIVLKPRDGLSSVGLALVADESDLDDWFTAQHDWYDPAHGQMLAESFVAGRMHHVDGMIIDGKPVVSWPSEYLYDLAGFDRSPEQARLDVMLDVNDPLASRLTDFVKTLIAAMPSPSCSTFHAEVFRTPDDELVLCEIASRNGGALIKSVLHAGFAVDFPAAWVRMSVGLPVPELAAAGPAPARIAGQVLLLNRAGTVAAVPDSPPFDWVERYEAYAAPGECIQNARSSGDFLAAMVVFANDRPTCERRMTQAAAWFDQHLILRSESVR